VVEEIEAAGGKAVANTDDVADSAGAERLIQQAIGEFGYLDVLVNNAGFLRDRVLVNLGEDEWTPSSGFTSRGTSPRCGTQRRIGAWRPKPGERPRRG
jgi:NAD(P)-dependent dehydrogenase (short-subunit alcohol dehydrogenase family)